MTSRQLVPALIIPFIAWRIYSRVRRNVGRQPLAPRKLKVSIIAFSIITVLFALGGLFFLPALGGLAGGLALAVPIALVGLKLTKFEDTPQGKFYTPNT